MTSQINYSITLQEPIHQTLTIYYYQKININLTLAIMQVHASCCHFTQSLLFNFTVLIKKLQVNRSVTLPQFLTSLPKLCQINLNI